MLQVIPGQLVVCVDPLLVNWEAEHHHWHPNSVGNLIVWIVSQFFVDAQGKDAIGVVCESDGAEHVDEILGDLVVSHFQFEKAAEHPQ